MPENINLVTLSKQPSQAIAVVQGSSSYPKINGNVYFYETESGIVVIAQISGLPSYTEACKDPVFGFHIHSGGSCTGNETDPFADALTHYNPNNCLHPYHSGDMPPLFGNNGYAFLAFLTNRFTLNEIIGKTVIIHSKPDDFTTQPSGNSGAKIACGEIKDWR